MSKLNVEAQKERHEKLFEGHYQTAPGRMWFHTKRALWHLYQNQFFLPSGKHLSSFMHPLDTMPAPRRLYTQMALFSVGLLLLNSVTISNAAYDGGEGVGKEYLSLEVSESYITDEEGYIIKNMPLTGEATFDQNRTDREEYEVTGGDTLSMIAYRYGLSVNSIRYTNLTLGSGDYLKVGQKLVIPPKDGVYVKVESGNTLVALMDKYKGNLEKSKEFNGLEDDSSLVAGEEIFIVDGRPAVVYVASTSGAVTSYELPTVMQYNIPPSAEGWIRPTQGKITQGFRGGHYGYDIADRSRPAILAASSGLVVYASSGTWDGGFGTNLWIDHGNGYRTHYAHMEVIYVNEGESVSQGQVIAKMGNTGRVYGGTGIHLHFELEYNGVKISPSMMGVW